MGRSTKSVLWAIVLLAPLFVLAMGVHLSPQGERIAKTVSLVVVIACLSQLIVLHLRSDEEVDYLSRLTKRYFNRDGLCFALTSEVIDSTYCLKLYVQNQFDRPCVGRIALHPKKFPFLAPVELSTIVFNVSCEPAGFYLATMPIPVPKRYQGTPQTFDIGASVEYPEGQGNRVRFRDGLYIRTNDKFEGTQSPLLSIGGLFLGMVLYMKSATCHFSLPTNVHDELTGVVQPSLQMIWKLGDAPLPE